MKTFTKSKIWNWVGVTLCLATMTLSAQISSKPETSDEPSTTSVDTEPKSSDPLDIQSWLGKGMIAEETGRLDTAVKMYKGALEQYESQKETAAQAVYRLAEVYRKLGAEKTATEFYERILTEFSDQTELVQNSRGHVNQAKIESAGTFLPRYGGGGVRSPGRYGGAMSFEMDPLTGLPISKPPVYLNDPEYQRIQGEMETVQAKLNRLRQNQLSLEMEEMNFTQKLSIAENADPLHLPSQLDPGPGYEKLKAEYEDLRFDRGSIPSIPPRQERLKKTEQALIDWFESSFLTQLKADHKAVVFEKVFLSEKLKEESQRHENLKRDLNEIEKKFARPKSSAETSGSDQVSTFEEADINGVIQTETLRNLLAEKFRVRMELDQYESLLNELTTKGGDDLLATISFATPGTQIPQLLQDLYRTQQALAEKNPNFGSNHPDIKQLEALKKTIQEQMDREVGSVLSGLKAQVDSSRTRMEKLEVTINEIQQQYSRDNQIKVSVLGAVKNPDLVVFKGNGRTPTILEAITRAGGFNDRANQKKINLIREMRRTTYSMAELFKSDKKAIQIKDGDVIQVEEKPFVF